MNSAGRAQCAWRVPARCAPSRPSGNQVALNQGARCNQSGQTSQPHRKSQATVPSARNQLSPSITAVTAKVGSVTTNGISPRPHLSLPRRAARHRTSGPCQQLTICPARTVPELSPQRKRGDDSRPFALSQVSMNVFTGRTIAPNAQGDGLGVRTCKPGREKAGANGVASKTRSTASNGLYRLCFEKPPAGPPRKPEGRRRPCATATMMRPDLRCRRT